jgi:pilus assembly protein CpaE
MNEQAASATGGQATMMKTTTPATATGSTHERTVAYSFSLPGDERHGNGRKHDEFGGVGGGAAGGGRDGGVGSGGASSGGAGSGASGTNDSQGSIATFTSSEACRTTLKSQSSAVSVIVCSDAGVVSPINLAAALCADTPERDVYLVENNPTESLAGRARAAGIRGILDSSQAHRLLAIGGDTSAQQSQQSEQSEQSEQKRFERPFSPLASPVTPAAAAIPTALPTTAESFPNLGRVIGFFSGRGGVGKSTAALLTACAAQKRGARVALVDLDLQFGDMDYLAGKEPSGRIQRLSLTQLCAQKTMPALANEALTLVLAPDHPEQGEQLAPAIPHLLRELAARRDLVIINTGSFWMDIHAQATQRCDYLIFLMDQRATSIKACKQAVDLCLRLKIPQARFRYLLNGCGRHAALTPQDVSLALGGVEVCGLADGGTLVDELLALGCPFELLTSGNALITSLERFLDGLLEHQQPEARLEQTGQTEPRKAKIFDLVALRNFFGEAHRVAT